MSFLSDLVVVWFKTNAYNKPYPYKPSLQDCSLRQGIWREFKAVSSSLDVVKKQEYNYVNKFLYESQLGGRKS